MAGWQTPTVPLTGTYNMIFRLYNVATDGALLWEEQWTGCGSIAEFIAKKALHH